MKGRAGDPPAGGEKFAKARQIPDRRAVKGGSDPAPFGSALRPQRSVEPLVPIRISYRVRPSGAGSGGGHGLPPG